MISQPVYAWEKQGLNVNEGPVALQHEGETFTVYSANFCGTPDYKLGMLRYNGGDPLNAPSWEKYPEPVFQRSDENGVYGPGHNGFFTSPDGSESWIVYHANDSVGDGCASAPMVMRITTCAIRTSTWACCRCHPIRWTHSSGSFPAWLTRRRSPSSSVNFPGFYLRHQNNALLLSATDNSASFAGESTWWLRPGLVDEQWISIESYDVPGKFVGRMIGIPALVEVNAEPPESARGDATFLEETL